MNCTICFSSPPSEQLKGISINNDCVLDCLEKIKSHYIYLKQQLSENHLVINALKDTTRLLEKNIESYEKTEQKTNKKRRGSILDDDGPKLHTSDIFESPVVNKLEDDLNMALNDENEFEISFISNTPIENEEKPILVKREPMKTIPSPAKNVYNKNTSPYINDKLGIKMIPRKNTRKLENKVTSPSWISKGNDIKKNTIGSFYKPANTSARHIKTEHKPNRSLSSVRLRQSKLQLHISKNISENSDSTFCEEAIDASPKSDSISKKSNSSRQWMLRNNSKNYVDKQDTDSSFNRSNLCSSPKKHASPKAENMPMETSSVVMLTPATQDIIFLDDSCESFNIESMDLLKDLMNPSEGHLSNLRRIESNGIKLLQKTRSAKIECAGSKKENNNLIHKVEESNAKSENYPTDMDSSNYFPNKSKCIDTSDKIINSEHQEKSKRQQLFNVECKECQMYIKYLGAHLTDEEIDQHLRKCTKHKKRVEINLTPDGFWDPQIKPLNKDDPRNETLVDTRFIGKERRN